MARILHISDTHIGLTLRGVDRRPDHEAVLDEIVEIADNIDPHLVLHTGDLFHTPNPPNDAVELAFRTLHRLTDRGRRTVIVLRGNHDGIHHFRALQAVLDPNSQIILVDVPKHPDDGGVVEVDGDSGEVIRLAPVPFIESNRGRLIERLLTQWQTWQTQYADGIATVTGILGQALERDYDPTRHILVFAAHLHLDSAVPSRSEARRHVVEEYAARVSCIPKTVSYAAFGHIHNGQRLQAPMPAWYPGSPLPVDFGEISDEKRVLRIDAAPGQGATVTEIPLRRTGRRLMKIDDTLAGLAARAAVVDDAIVDIIVRSDTAVPDLAERVREVLPRATLATVTPAPADAVLAATSGGGRGLTDEASEGFDALFHRFLESQTLTLPADTLFATFCHLLDDHEGTVPFDAEDGLARASDGDTATAPAMATARPPTPPPSAVAVGGGEIVVATDAATARLPGLFEEESAVDGTTPSPAGRRRRQGAGGGR